MQTTKFELNQNINKKEKVLCNQCGRKTNHTIRANYEEIYSEEEGAWSFYANIDYQIIQCDGCDSISFRQQSMNSEDFEYVDYYNGNYDCEPIVQENIYPQRKVVKHSFDTGELFMLPSGCREIYEETEIAIANKQLLLAAIGLRSLIETICKHQEQEGRICFPAKSNLVTKIEKFIEHGFLPQISKDILDSIRTMGNDAVHDVKKQPIEQIELAFQVLETLLRTLYVHPQKFEQLKR